MKRRRKIISISLIIIAFSLIIGCLIYWQVAQNTDEPVNEIEPKDISLVVEEPKEENETSGAKNEVVEEKNKSNNFHELYESFLAGEIDGFHLEDDGSLSNFSVSVLNLDGEEWDSFHVYGYKDADNDGEEELVLQGPYGFYIYDIWDGEVVEFAAGEGNGSTCLLANYDNACWIAYAYAGAYEEYYSMNKYSGSKNKVESFVFGMEADENGNQSFYKDNESSTEDEYNKLIESIETPSYDY